MNRPPHIDRAIAALMDFTACAGQIPFGDCCELSHYIARLERQAAERETEHTDEVAFGVRAIYRLAAFACLCEILMAVLLWRWVP